MATAGAFLEAAPNAYAAGPASAWSNCYLGGQFGVASSGSRWDHTNSNPYSATGNTTPIIMPGVDFGQTRGIIGAQVGCNTAITDDWLIGLEGSWISNPMNHHNGKPGFFPDPTVFPPTKEVVTTNIQSVFAFTGKLGFAPSPDWLIYGKGGYAIARIETSGTVSPDFSSPVFDFNTRAWHHGWTVGAGIEYRLFRNVTIGAEYNYYRFANVTHTGTVAAQDIVNNVATPANPVIHRVSANMHTVMARINFGFDPFGTSTSAEAANAMVVKAPVAQSAGRFTAFNTTEAKFSSWTGTRGANVFSAERGSGSQLYAPTTFGFDYLLPDQYKLEARIKSGYVYASQNTVGQSAQYNGPVDTQTSFNLTLLSFDSIRPIFGLSMNLPTGNSYLPGNQRFTRMDPDLVDIGSYGVGFNINPTAGFIFGLNESTAISLSAGYAWQGDFTKEGINVAELVNPAPPPATIVVNTFDLKQRVSPGNTYTLNGNISSTFDSLTLIGSFAYLGSSHASIDGMAAGRAGAKLTANGTAKYRFDDRTAVALNLSWAFAEKNDIPNGFGGLVTEPSNSNSHVFTGSLEPSYMLTDRLRLAANYSFLYRDHNFYDPLQQQFIPAKQKHLVGASATYAMTETASITLRGSHAWVEQKDGPFLVTTAGPPQVLALQPPSLRYDVWAASLSVNARF